MEERTKKLNFSDVKNAVKLALSWRYFPFVTAAVTLLSYFFGLDLLAIYFIGITGTLITLLCDDLSPLFGDFVLMPVLISDKNSPAPNLYASSYYSAPAVLAQVFIIIALFAGAVIYRFTKNCVRKKVKLTPMFFGLCAFSLILFFNGMLSKNYVPKNMLYGAIMAFAFTFIFIVFKDDLRGNDNTFISLAVAFTALSVVLLTELIYKYATAEGIILDGVIQRTKIKFGWGVYNQAGMMMLTCVPATMFLASKLKHGYLLFVYSLVVAVGTVFTMSRQAIMTLAVIMPASVIMLLAKGKNKVVNGAITAAVGVALIILACVKNEGLAQFFGNLEHSLATGNGRTVLWEEGIKNFMEAPFLGAGFYAGLGSYSGISGVSFLPDMAHSTFIEILSACGICGLLTYLVHRTQTILSFVKNPCTNRIYLVLIILCILLTSLLDNHLFNIFPTMLYGILVAVLAASEEKTER